MDYNKKTLKKYQTIKINSYIKTNKFLFFFLSNKSTNINWKKNEQILKKLNLTYYKTINKIILRKFKTSVYKNFTALISGIVLLIASSLKQSKRVERIETILHKNFNLLGLKLNNKIYSVNEIKTISDFSYKKILFVFYRFLEKYSKISNSFCNKNSK